MKILICDRCGVRARPTKGSPGAVVCEVKVGQHGGRIIHLCGPCRSDFADAVSSWLLNTGMGESRRAVGDDRGDPSLLRAVNRYLLAQNSRGFSAGHPDVREARLALCRVAYAINARDDGNEW